MKAQVANYISNASFENRYDCFPPYSMIKVKSWSSIDSMSFGGLHASLCYSAVPINGNTFQYPKSGDTYIINTVYWENTLRGYMKNRLKQNLKSGKTYCARFYINIANTSPRGMDGIGIYFGDNSIDTITKCTIPLIYINPQVKNQPGNVLSDTLNWVPITGTFVANGTEKYALIGNFLADNAVTTTSINTPSFPEKWTDVCIDDVSVIELDLPAFAGNDTSCIPGSAIYIGRQRDVGIDEACTWYQLPNMSAALDTAAGIWVSPTVTSTYVVRQEICGNVKWDTVVVYRTEVGLSELSMLGENLNVFPVPANDFLELQISNEYLFEEFKSVSIYNSLGQMIREEEIEFKEKALVINISQFPNGVYSLQIKNGSLQTVSKRFVVSR